MTDLSKAAVARGRNWHEDYVCAHCGRRVRLAVAAAWLAQCPHCLVWTPTLTMATPGWGKFLDAADRGVKQP